MGYYCCPKPLILLLKSSYLTLPPCYVPIPSLALVLQVYSWMSLSPLSRVFVWKNSRGWALPRRPPFYLKNVKHRNKVQLHETGMCATLLKMPCPYLAKHSLYINTRVDRLRDQDTFLRKWYFLFVVQVRRKSITQVENRKQPTWILESGFHLSGLALWRCIHYGQVHKVSTPLLSSVAQKWMEDSSLLMHLHNNGCKLDLQHSSLAHGPGLIGRHFLTLITAGRNPKCV